MYSKVPDCFGRTWDQNAAECAGGRDPNYTDGNGTHIRERCDFFNSCGAKKQAAEQERKVAPSFYSNPIIPASSLTRRFGPQPPPTSYAQPYAGHSPSHAPSQLEQELHRARIVIQQQEEALQQRYAVGQAPPTRTPNMMAMDMYVPKYLSTPEPRAPGQSVWAVLGREVMRGVMKAAGHTVASYWDRTPIGEKPDDNKGPE